MKKSITTIILSLNIIICSAQKYGVKTNFLELITGSLNVEASCAITNKWTVHIPISWNPFTLPNNYKILHMTFQPGVRWWLWHSYSGIFFGSQIIASKYNIGMNKYRYQGWLTGIALSSGYSWLLSKSWNLDAEIGFGKLYKEYDKYERVICGDYISTSKSMRLGITKISFSVMYIF